MWAQVATKPAAATAPAPALKVVMGPKIPPQGFTNLEEAFNLSLRGLKTPVDILGGTRALYLRDYGLVLTTEVSLVQTPTINPFRTEISPRERAQIHQRKLAQVPLLMQEMRKTVNRAAISLAGLIGAPQHENSGLQVALIVRVLYLPWEDTTGLPAQITMKAPLNDAIAEKVQEEVQ
jgi:hypothetical protein